MDQASAGNGIFHCEGGINHGVGGSVSFFNDATAAQGIFTVEGGASARSGGGDIYFGDSSTAGDASITVNGTNFSGALPGLVQFAAVTSATAGNASLVANAGSVAGGEIRFAGPTTSGGTARIELVGNGTLNVSGSLHPAITIGSLTGDGVVLLGSNPLTIGSNSLSTLFSGVIEGTGTITKIGSGTLTLGGASTYTGATTVSAGVLLVANQTGSATGSGLVSVNSGTLGGGGIISGGVEIGGGATLAPASGSSNQVTLTLQQSLNLTAGAKYLYGFKARASQSRTDLVIANGITISNATITLKGKTQGTLTLGRVLRVLSNTSANPISGVFSNLADGAIVTVNGNKLQASYSGGDGNDLTLTVVP